MAQESSNALRYRDLLKNAAEGICLWHPSKIAVVGSVGYLREGRFIALFNAFSPPDGLPSLPQPTGPPDLDTNVLPNIHLVWMSHAETGCSLHMGVPIDSTQVNIGFSVHSQTADAAFLVPGGSHRRVETLDGDRQLEKYLTDNYNAIAKQFPTHAIGTLMILRGTTHTNGYCRGLLRQSGRAVEGTLTLSPLGADIFSVGMGGNQSVSNYWLIQTDSASTQNQPDPTYIYCIIIKPILCRTRKQLWRRLIHSLTSVFGIFTQDSAHSRPTPVPPPNNSPYQALAEPSANAPVVTGRTADAMDDNGLSLPDSTDPPDDFEMLLDEALNAHPDLNTVVTDWDVLHTFWEHHSHEANDRNHRLIFDLEILTGATDGRVARIRAISSLPDRQRISVEFTAMVILKMVIMLVGRLIYRLLPGSRVQSQRPPASDPVPWLGKPPPSTPTLSKAELGTRSAAGETPEAIAPEAAAPTLPPHVLASHPIPAEKVSLEVSPGFTLPAPLVRMTPSLPNEIEKLGLAVQDLLAAFERYDANLFQPLAAALDGFVKLSEDVKEEWGAEEAFAVLKARLSAFRKVANAMTDDDVNSNTQEHLRTMAEIVQILWTAADFEAQLDHGGRSAENIGEIQGSLELLAGMLEFFGLPDDDSVEHCLGVANRMVTSPSMPVQLASPEVSPALTSSIPLAIPTLSPPNNRLEDFDSAFQGLRAAVERGEANLFQPLAAALDAIVKLGDDLKEQWEAENVFAVLKVRVNAFLETAKASMTGSGAESDDDIQIHLHAVAKIVQTLWSTLNLEAQPDHGARFAQVIGAIQYQLGLLISMLEVFEFHGDEFVTAVADPVVADPPKPSSSARPIPSIPPSFLD